ncbi:MAG: hypothetical protein ACXVJ8_11390 [Candidatus Angelobacter sp.]
MLLQAQPPATMPARKFVRQIIDHQRKAEAEDHSHWRYLVYHEEPGKTETREVIETGNGDVEVVLSRNGRALTSEERQEQIQHLRRLASHPAELQTAHSAQHEDAAKADEMLRILPDAFLFQYERMEGDYALLKFRPDPAFRPPSREAKVFHSMAGEIRLNTREQRLAVLHGQLIDDVKFGAGVLGHLYMGGWFRVEQSEVAPGYWELTRLDVEVSGKALLFKTISLHQKERRTDYRRVADNLTLAQAVDLLIREQAGPQIAGRPF